MLSLLTYTLLSDLGACLKIFELFFKIQIVFIFQLVWSEHLPLRLLLSCCFLTVVTVGCCPVWIIPVSFLSWLLMLWVCWITVLDMLGSQIFYVHLFLSWNISFSVFSWMKISSPVCVPLSMFYSAGLIVMIVLNHIYLKTFHLLHWLKERTLLCIAVLGDVYLISRHKIYNFMLSWILWLIKKDLMLFLDEVRCPLQSIVKKKIYIIDMREGTIRTTQKNIEYSRKSSRIT